jgi:hypothetical protein
VAIERKVARYRRRAEQHDLPFVVVLSADDDTAMDVAHGIHVQPKICTYFCT